RDRCWCRISPGPERIVDYMEQRKRERAGHRYINLELMVLSRAVGQKWSVLWPTVAKLGENKDVGRALEPEEEKTLMETAERNPSPL
ncbi:MAG TPA: hypothetical protein VEV85_14225, partial [Bryobacteraceae bacterium]|nr:hypothetical protein [Bryobacteraceae bacterium]